MFKKILVPIDGSEHSTRALENAIQMAKQFGGEITLMHIYSVTVAPMIVPEPTTGFPGMPTITAAEISKVAEAAREIGNRILTDGEERVKAEGIEAKKLLVEGHPVQEIIRTAKEENFDLIVVGARGRSKIREIILGSVSESVVHHAHCPVLVVK